MKQTSNLKTSSKRIEKKPLSITKKSNNLKTDVKPASQTKIISQKTIISKQQKRQFLKPTIPKANLYQSKKKKQQIVKGGITWSLLPFGYLLDIAQFACSQFYQIYLLSTVCKVWRIHLTGQDGQYFWNRLKGGQSIPDFANLKLFLDKQLAQQEQKRSFQFQKIFTKLFDYGSTKQNIPNKMITKLDLQVKVKLNKRPFQIIPFKLRNFNFSSYLFAKITDINEFKYDFTTPHNMFKDNLEIQIQFYSKRYRAKHTISKKYIPEQVHQFAIKQKAFNYFLDKNIVLTYFQGDNHFIYMFFQISVLELIETFRKAIKNKNKETLQKNMKKVPKHKQLCQTQFENFVQYLKFQADFELHLSYHNSVKQIFTHCDTKVYPVEYNEKQAYFNVKVQDSFDSASTFKLDNKMGMSQNVPNLYLLDFVLKDRDRFLIVFSGFIYARKATQKERQNIQDYFKFSEHQMKILEFKAPKYSFKILMVDQEKRNLMKYVDFILYP